MQIINNENYEELAAEFKFEVIRILKSNMSKA